jgi:hypothetical protein
VTTFGLQSQNEDADARANGNGNGNEHDRDEGAVALVRRGDEFGVEQAGGNAGVCEVGCMAASPS